MRLQTKILLPILLLIVVLMGVSGVLSYSTIKGTLTQALVDNMEGEAHAINRVLKTAFEDSARDVERTIERSDIRAFTGGDIHASDRQLEVSETLDAVNKTYPSFERLTIYDPEGIVVASSDKKVIGDSFADRIYIQKVKETRKLYISAPFLSRVSKSSVIVVAAPIIRDGKFVGIFTGNMSLARFFTETVAPVSLATDGYAFVLSSEGDVVVHKNTDWAFNKDLPEKEVYKRLAKKEDGLDSFMDANGAEVVVYTAKEPLSGMVTVIRADADDVFASLIDIRNQTVAVAVAGVLLGLLVVLLIIRPVTNAVRQGAAFAGEIARGNLSSTLAVRRKDEIGNLADALRAIPTVLKDITSVYQHLENDVESGYMDAQGDVSRFQGEYADLIKGTNAIVNRFRMVLDYIPSPVVVLTKESKATFLNTQAKELAGSDYQGKTCHELFAREDHGTPADALRRAIDSGQPASGETRAHPRGKTLDVSYSSIPMKDAQGKIASVLQLLTDLTAIRSSQRTMTEVASQATDISNRMAAASEELSAQVEQVSRGTDLQRGRVGSTATAMEQMNATVLEVARSASEARGQADTTRNKAHEGASLVDKVVNSIAEVNAVAQQLQGDMEQLGKQAEAIGGVMNVISDIADQTNLLALNAAIEAARAGEAGRGFAVVADEVRKLAEKTMSATTEVGGNIRGIQQSTNTNAQRVTEAATSVAEATRLAASSGEALREILSLADKNSELVTSIATAAEEQSATSEEINRSVEEINRIADETASGMEESSSAVHEIAGMSQELKTLLERLRS